MTYDLFIGDAMYSSWSMRGWLCFKAFDIDASTHFVGLYSGTMADDLAPLAPARLVPAMRTPEGVVVGESLAIAETLAERFPNAGLWPGDPAHRATARWLCSEIATGMSALRGQCPMQFQRIYQDFPVDAALRKDLDRVETLWAHARAVSGAKTGWLFGRYSLADVFYTPVAARIVGYDLPVSPEARRYCAALLGTGPVREWRRMAHAVAYDPEPYQIDCAGVEWALDAPSER